MVDTAPLVQEAGDILVARKLWLATAESCTGGLLSHLLTNVAGSSDWFRGGVVAYSNDLKTDLLGVDGEILVHEGAVSGSCVQAMARGACSRLGAQVGVAVSGIAGPGGGSREKPVGTVWIGWAVLDRVFAERFQFAGTREEIKARSARQALTGVLDELRNR